MSAAIYSTAQRIGPTHSIAAEQPKFSTRPAHKTTGVLTFYSFHPTVITVSVAKKTI